MRRSDGSGDPPEGRPAARIVERRGLVHVLGDLLQPGEEQQHREADRPPDRRDRQRRQHEVRVAEERQRLRAERLPRSPRRPASGASMKRQISVTIVTDSTAEEKKMPRNTAAPLLARLSASASSSAIDGQRRHDHQRHLERVDQRRAEDRIVGQPHIIAGADEMAGAEQVDLVEAEPQAAQQREDQDERIEQQERRDEQQPAPVARRWSCVAPGDSRRRRCRTHAPRRRRSSSATSSPIFTRLSPSSSAVIGWPSARRA